jgi:hypothetical protein
MSSPTIASFDAKGFAIARSPLGITAERLNTDFAGARKVQVYTLITVAIIHYKAGLLVGFFERLFLMCSPSPEVKISKGEAGTFVVARVAVRLRKL